jgi:hypothetical protein
MGLRVSAIHGRQSVKVATPRRARLFFRPQNSSVLQAGSPKDAKTVFPLYFLGPQHYPGFPLAPKSPRPDAAAKRTASHGLAEIPRQGRLQPASEYWASSASSSLRLVHFHHWRSHFSLCSRVPCGQSYLESSTYASQLASGKRPRFPQATLSFHYPPTTLSDFTGGQES